MKSLISYSQINNKYFCKKKKTGVEDMHVYILLEMRIFILLNITQLQQGVLVKILEFAVI